MKEKEKIIIGAWVACALPFVLFVLGLIIGVESITIYQWVGSVILAMFGSGICLALLDGGTI